MVDGPSDRRPDTEVDPSLESDSRPTRAEGGPRTPRSGGQGSPSSAALATDRYQIGELLGAGGMGEVLTATDTQLGREVAVKRMLHDDSDGIAVERFFREARVQGRLDHPAIVPVHELGRDRNGLPYFVMKKVAGTTLAELIKREAPDKSQRQRLLRAFVDVCLAVEFAHAKGVIHRDLKPDNIVLGDYGEVYVLDWGVAKLVGEDETGAFADLSSGSGSGSGNHNATVVGTVLGTPGFIAPEQVRGNPDVDGRADVYSLGCVLFELLSGHRLHPDGFDGMDSAVTGVDARPSRRAPDRDIPPELDAVCSDATRIDPGARPATARELAARVERFLDGDRDLAARRELARSHLDAAQAALDAGDGEADERRTALREAGRALVLDPTSPAAAEMVTRLTLEPPKVVPPEVTIAMVEDERDGAAHYLQLGVRIYLAFLLITPMLWWIAPSGSRALVALTGAILIAAGLNWLASKYVTFGWVLATVVFNAVVIGIIARVYSPLLIAPGVATLIVLSTTITTTAPMWFGRTVIPLISTLGVIAPWLAERLDLVSRTTEVISAGVMQLQVAAIGGDELPILGTAALYVGALLFASSFFATTIRTRNQELKQRLHLQAWQLRQLVGS